MKVKQATHLVDAGVVGVAFWVFDRTLFLDALVRLAIGAAAGEINGSLSDYGINDNFIKEV
jgi:uncharacterized membrane protein